MWIRRWRKKAVRAQWSGSWCVAMRGSQKEYACRGLGKSFVQPCTGTHLECGDITTAPTPPAPSTRLAPKHAPSTRLAPKHASGLIPSICEYTLLGHRPVNKIVTAIRRTPSTPHHHRTLPLCFTPIVSLNPIMGKQSKKWLA